LEADGLQDLLMKRVLDQGQARMKPVLQEKIIKIQASQIFFFFNKRSSCPNISFY
jgi:hypothetical protein